MPPFQPKQTRAGAGADRAFLDRPVARRAIACRTCSRRHVHAADIVQAAVVRLAHERVDRPDLLVARLRERVPHDRLHRRADARACWSARSASRSCRARRPASSPRACRTRCRRTPRPPLCPETDCRRAARWRSRRSGRIALDERGVADPHAGDVGDRVERTRRKYARVDIEIARSRPSLRLAENSCAHKD